MRIVRKHDSQTIGQTRRDDRRCGLGHLIDHEEAQIDRRNIIDNSHMGELLWYDQPVVPNQSPAGGLHSFLAIGSQRNVRDAGMLAAQRPLRLAVTDNEDPRRRHVEVFLLGRSGRPLGKSEARSGLGGGGLIRESKPGQTEKLM